MENILCSDTVAHRPLVLHTLPAITAGIDTISIPFHSAQDTDHLPRKSSQLKTCLFADLVCFRRRDGLG